LEFLYFRYLDNEDSAGYIRAVSQRYTLSTLERLTERGRFQSRRAAALAISYLGDFRQNAVLGRALQDPDRGVRMLADNGLRELWRRDGNLRQRRQLADIMRRNVARQAADVLTLATRLIDSAPWFAEAWNQRAIANFQLQRFEQSANDCHQTLELNPYHFPAAIGMAHCYLEMDETLPALECFRRALKLNPDLEEVRAQADYLQRTWDEG
jgi:tetratricopeptide (TPR) repeat protein